MATRGKQTLIQRIALEGGQAIKEELQKLGDAGRKAFDLLKKAADDASVGSTRFGAAMLKLRAQIKVVGDQARLVGNEMRNVGDAALRVGRNVAALTIAATGAAVALFKVAKASADMVDAQVDSSTALGLTLGEYARLKFAFEQSGSSAEGMQTSLTRLNKAIGEAATGAGPTAALFRRLGVNVIGAGGQIRSTELIFQDLATAFSKMPEGAGKASIALQIFGRSGTQVIQTLNNGKAGLVAFGQEAERLGIVLDDTDAKLGAQLNDSFDRLKSTTDALRLRLGLLFAPVIIEGINQLTKLVSDNAVVWRQMGEAVANEVVPVVRDFFAILRGDDAAVVNKSLLGVRDTVVSIANAFAALASTVGFVFNSIANAIQLVLDPINALFGTNIRAQEVLFFLLLGQIGGAFRLLFAAIKLVSVTWGALVLVFGQTAATVAAAVAGVLLLVGTLQETVNRISQAIGQYVVDSFKLVVDGVGGMFQGLAEFIGTIFEDVTTGIDNIITAAKEAIGVLLRMLGLQSTAASSGDGNPIQANAAGGHIQGRGTGTSDSILSWLSNGEYVIKAAAVRKYGTGLLGALNGMRLPKSGFAMGGLVSALTTGMSGAKLGLPAFAGGGPVDAAGQPLTLNIGGETFEGLLAPEQVAEKLVRFATTRQIKRAGRTPSWYVGG